MNFTLKDCWNYISEKTRKAQKAYEEETIHTEKMQKLYSWMAYRDSRNALAEAIKTEKGNKNGN